MNELESIFLSEPLEKPCNLRLCKLTAVLVFSSILTTGQRPLTSPVGCRAPLPPLLQQHYPLTRCTPQNFPVKNYQNQDKEGGTAPCPLSSAITRRQHTGCPLKAVPDPGSSRRGLALPVQQRARAARPVGRGALPAGRPVVRGDPGEAGGPVGWVPSGMPGPCRVQGLGWLGRGQAPGDAVPGPGGGGGGRVPGAHGARGPGGQRSPVPPRPGEPRGPRHRLPALRPRGRGRHCGFLAAAAAAAKHAGEGGGGVRGGGGGAGGAGGAAGPGGRAMEAPSPFPSRSFLRRGASYPRRSLPPSRLASPRPFLTGRGVDLGGFPLQGHPQRRVQAGPVRHAAAGEARGRLGRRRAGHGPPLTQTPRCGGGGRWHRRGLAAGAGEALSPRRAGLPAAALLRTGLGAAAEAAFSSTPSLRAVSQGNSLRQRGLPPLPRPAPGEGRPAARRCRPHRPHGPGDTGLRGRCGLTAPGAPTGLRR